MPLHPRLPLQVPGAVAHGRCPGAEDRARAPPARGAASPLIDQARVRLEVEFAQPGQLREPARQHQGLDAVRMAGGEADRDRAAERHPQQHRLPGIARIQDRLDVRGQGREP